MSEDLELKADALAIKEALENLNQKMKVCAHPKLSVRIQSTNRFNKKNKAPYLELQIEIFQILEQVLPSPPEPTKKRPDLQLVEGGNGRK